MKRFLLLFTLLAGFTVMVNAQAKPADFKFEKETHNFGQIVLGTPAIYDFKFINTGDEPLLITKVEPTNGIVVDFTQTPVKKGEAGIIKVTFNPTGVPMPFSKIIKILSNAKTPTKVIYIKGETIKAAAN